MDVDDDQPPLSPSEPAADDAEATEQTPLTDAPAEEYDPFADYVEPEYYDWNTSLVSEVRTLTRESMTLTSNRIPRIVGLSRWRLASSTLVRRVQSADGIAR